MKAKMLFLASLLALTGCGGEADMSVVSGGDEVEKGTFEGAFLIRNLFLNSNFHMDVSYKQTEMPGGREMYSKSVDFNGPKLKVTYNLDDIAPAYFDFSASNESSSFTFDLYHKENDEAQSYYKQTYKNVSISNDFMGINDLFPVTYGLGITLVSGLDFSKFEFSGGVYQNKEPIKVNREGMEYDFSSLKVSMSGTNPKEVYYKVASKIQIDVDKFMDVTSEAHMYFSKYGQVTVTLPEVNQ